MNTKRNKKIRETGKGKKRKKENRNEWRERNISHREINRHFFFISSACFDKDLGSWRPPGRIILKQPRRWPSQRRNNVWFEMSHLTAGTVFIVSNSKAIYAPSAVFCNGWWRKSRLCVVVLGIEWLFRAKYSADFLLQNSIMAGYLRFSFSSIHVYKGGWLIPVTDTYSGTF